MLKVGKIWMYCIAVSLCCVSAAGAAECRAKLGDVVDVDSCQSVELPEFDVRYKGVTQPTPGLPVSCWNYEVTSKKDSKKQGATVDFRHCHTGDLGGSEELALGNVRFTVVFDVVGKCGTRGHAFFSPALTEKALLEFEEKERKEDTACPSKNGRTS
jgi:hypothetical protein